MAVNGCFVGNPGRVTRFLNRRQPDEAVQDI
jgi:hypothetical protein